MFECLYNIFLSKIQFIFDIISFDRFVELIKMMKKKFVFSFGDKEFGILFKTIKLLLTEL